MQIIADLHTHTLSATHAFNTLDEMAAKAAALGYAALASTEPNQQDLLAFLDDELTPNNKAEQEQCAKLKAELDGYKWDGLRDHTSQAISDDLWRRLSTDKASCLNRNCHYYVYFFSIFPPVLCRPARNSGGGGGCRQPRAGDGRAGE